MKNRRQYSKSVFFALLYFTLLWNGPKPKSLIADMAKYPILAFFGVIGSFNIDLELMSKCVFSYKIMDDFRTYGLFYSRGV